MTYDCDVLVAGAGPAGSVAAMELAKAGARVRIVDRATFPRDKLCGDTLNPASVAILARLDASVTRLLRTRALPTTGMRVTGPDDVAVAATYPHGMSGAAVKRRELDEWLLLAAIHSGAAFDQGAAVIKPLFSDDGRVGGVQLRRGSRLYALRSRVVIAADGRASRLAAALKLSRFARAPRRWAFGAYFEGVDRLDDHGEMHIRANGYVGIAPLPDGIANVCVVREQQDPSMRQTSERLVAGVLAGDTALADRFATARRVSPISVLGPLAVESNASGSPGMLLAGDAAGFVDPMTGDGLRFALRGGELAARAAVAELEHGSPMHAELHRWRSREFRFKTRFNRALRALVGSPRGLLLACAASRLWPLPVQHLVYVAGDVRTARRGS